MDLVVDDLVLEYTSGDYTLRPVDHLSFKVPRRVVARRVHDRPRHAPPGEVVGRTTAGGGDRPRARTRTADRVGRRTDGAPRLRAGRIGAAADSILGAAGSHGGRGHARR